MALRPQTAEYSATETSILLEFLFRLGQAYLASGEQTVEVERILRSPWCS